MPLSKQILKLELNTEGEKKIVEYKKKRLSDTDGKFILTNLCPSKNNSGNYYYKIEVSEQDNILVLGNNDVIDIYNIN